MTKISSVQSSLIGTHTVNSKSEGSAAKAVIAKEVSDSARVPASVVLAQYKSTASYQKNCPNGTIIEPKEFPSNNSKELNILERYDEYPDYDSFECMFKQEANPTELPLINSEINDEVIYVSNLDMPYGTIAGTSTLDKILYTDSLRVCAAVAVVDKAHNTQSLIHVFPGYCEKTNKEIIGHILSASKPEDMEISVVPGYAPDTGKTLQFIFDTLKEIVPNNTPKLYNFSDNLYLGNCGLLLHNGELSCCNKENVKNRKTNPVENITYSKYEETKYAKAKDIEEMLASMEFPEIISEPGLRLWSVDNNLKMRFADRNIVEFLDADDKVVRKITAEPPANIYAAFEDRYFYDDEGNQKAVLHKEKGKPAEWSKQ